MAKWVIERTGTEVSLVHEQTTRSGTIRYHCGSMPASYPDDDIVRQVRINVAEYEWRVNSFDVVVLSDGTEIPALPPTIKS